MWEVLAKRVLPCPGGTSLDYQEPAIEFDDPVSQARRHSPGKLGLKGQPAPFEVLRDPILEII